MLGICKGEKPVLFGLYIHYTPGIVGVNSLMQKSNNRTAEPDLCQNFFTCIYMQR